LANLGKFLRNLDQIIYLEEKVEKTGIRCLLYECTSGSYCYESFHVYKNYYKRLRDMQKSYNSTIYRGQINYPDVSYKYAYVSRIGVWRKRNQDVKSQYLYLEFNISS